MDNTIVERLQQRFTHYVESFQSNDFKLLQLGWVYDINFLPSLQALRERRYLEQLHATLPQRQDINNIFHSIYEHIQKRIDGPPGERRDFERES